MNSIASVNRPLLAVPRPAASAAAPSAEPQDSFVASTPDDVVPPKLASALQASGHPYYDAVRDRAESAAYYAHVSPDAGPSEFYQQLHQLVSGTHREHFGFDPEKRLFPWVDLRPNLRLGSIYDPNPVAIDAPAHVNSNKDFTVKTKVEAKGRPQKDGSVGPTRLVNKKIDFSEQANEWGKALAEGSPDAFQIAQRLAAVEGRRYFNAEHSVPQYFFDHDKVPKGDMHHLFACERNSNSLRGCRPYSPVEHVDGNRGRDGWAPKQVNQFEPDAGKGAVARATLYFLARYPGEVGDRPGEYTKQDLQTLLEWNRENPVTLYEKHRNQSIADLQGNRNPFIDHPEWAEKVDFSAAFGDYGRTAAVSGATGRPI